MGKIFALKKLEVVKNYNTLFVSVSVTLYQIFFYRLLLWCLLDF